MKATWKNWRWEYQGIPLAPPLTIARRLLAWPVFQAVRCLLFVVVLAGWGLDDAQRTWSDTQ
jgi:hypothetical protein